MKKATNIYEWVNNFIPAQFLTKDKEAFRVPIYEDLLKKVRADILYTDYSELTVFVKGQKGTGKTTALNFLADESIIKEYHVVNLISSEYMEVTDVSMTYFLIQLCVKLLDDDTSGNLEGIFKSKVEKLRDVYEGRYNEEIERERKREGSLEIGFETGIKAEFPALLRFLSFFSPSFKADLKANGKANTGYRRIIKEAFQARPEDLKELVNEMLLEFRKNVCPDKQILLIINELDHMRDQSLIRKFFIEDKRYLTELRCKKVVSIPVYLQTETGFSNETVHTFCLKINERPGIIITDKAKDLIKKNNSFLHQIVQVRAEEGLFDEKAIELAIDKSGGIIRQFIEILYEAGKNARISQTNFVSKEDVEEAITTLRQQMEEKLAYKDKVTVLEEVRKEFVYPNIKDIDDSVFIDCLLNNLALFYQNTPNWCSVNPLIEETVEIYARPNSR